MKSLETRVTRLEERVKPFKQMHLVVVGARFDDEGAVAEARRALADSGAEVRDSDEVIVVRSFVRPDSKSVVAHSAALSGSPR